jgi:hypothetical protein
MSYLVIYTTNGQALTNAFPIPYHQKIDSLKDIDKLDAAKILAIYEIAREIPVQVKYREEEKVIQRKPYFEIDGSIEVDQKSTLPTLLGEI